MDSNYDIRLVIKIENNNPIELIDLTKSLVALANQFDSFISKHADSKENREAKLYVKEIKSGSVIFELIEIATIGVIAFIENTNTIIEFGKFFKKTIDYFLKNEGEKPDLLPNDYKEFSTILNPVSKDNGSQFNLSTTVNGNVEMHFHVNSTETNAIQNLIKNELDKLKEPEIPENPKERVLLVWYQARTDIKSKVGNKGIIEEISKKPLNITFENEALKEELIHGDINPFRTAYIVDVKVMTVQEKPTVYKILKLHEHFDLEGE
jgi:hypothetical protein